MRCLQCGKEIPEGRKFCSRSCSASYNNVRRERKPWTEEQHLKNRKVGQSFCTVCGKPIRSGKQFCRECRLNYGNVIPVLKKLGCWTGNIQSDIGNARKLLSLEYFDNRESLLTLSKKYGICKDTIKNYIGTVRTRSEANRNAVETKRHELYNSPIFKSGTHISWEGKKFRFRSSWEEEYMKQLDNQKVSYLYEPFSIRYFDTQRNEERVAIPDFFFPETNMIVELKSHYTYNEQNMKDKVQSYKKKGYKVKLLLDWIEMSL